MIVAIFRCGVFACLLACYLPAIGADAYAPPLRPSHFTPETIPTLIEDPMPSEQLVLAALLAITGSWSASHPGAFFFGVRLKTFS